MPVILNEIEVTHYLKEVFPEISAQWPSLTIEKISDLQGVFALKYDESMLRPGGTISGPTMMALADLAIYGTILGNIGPQALAVTTNLTFDFMNKPPKDDLICKCQILKLGKRLITARAEILSKNNNLLCTHAVGTYSIPPAKSV